MKKKFALFSLFLLPLLLVGQLSHSSGFFGGGGNSDCYYDAGNSGTSKTIDWSICPVQKVTLTGNATFTFLPPSRSGTTCVLNAYQDSTGSRTISWPAPVAWVGQNIPTPTTTTSRADQFVFLYDGTTYKGSYTLNYKDYNPNFEPSQLNNVKLFLDGSDSASFTIVSGKISQWNDKSGASKHATQSNASYRPVVTAAALNGKSVVNCTSPSFLSFSGLANGYFINTGSAFSIHWLGRQHTYAGTGYYGRLFSPADQNGKYLNIVLQDAQGGFFNSVQFSDNGTSAWVVRSYTGVGANEWHKWDLIYNGSGATSTGNFKLYKDDVDVSGSVAAGATAGSGSPQAICGIDGSNPPINVNYDLAEFVVVGEALSDSDRLTLSNYDLAYWGI